MAIRGQEKERKATVSKGACKVFGLPGTAFKKPLKFWKPQSEMFPRLFYPLKKSGRGKCLRPEGFTPF